MFSTNPRRSARQTRQYRRAIHERRTIHESSLKRTARDAGEDRDAFERRRHRGAAANCRRADMQSIGSGETPWRIAVDGDCVDALRTIALNQRRRRPASAARINRRNRARAGIRDGQSPARKEDPCEIGATGRRRTQGRGRSRAQARQRDRGMTNGTSRQGTL